jgi:hypothetical protein
MADAHDGGVAVRLDLLPGLGIVVLVGVGERDHPGLHRRHVLAEPILHFFQQLDRVVKAAVDEVDGFAVEALRPRRRGLLVDLRRIADRIENGDLLVDGTPDLSLWRGDDLVHGHGPWGLRRPSR